MKPSLWKMLIALLSLSTSVSAGIFDPKLLRSAEKGKLDEVRQLLDSGTDVNTKNGNGTTALMAAAIGGRSEVVGLLIQRGADVNAATSVGDTALSFASWKGHMEIVRQLVEARANVNTRGGVGRTPLYVAAHFQNIEVVRFLLANGADPHVKADDGTNAIRAVINKNPEEKELVRQMMAMEPTAAARATASITQSQGQNGPGSVVPCVEQEDVGLTAEEAKSIRYLFRKKLAGSMGLSGNAIKTSICIEKIIAEDKIEIRGDTVVTYQAFVMFPKGHRTECLGQGNDKATRERLEKNFNWNDFEHLSQNCNALLDQHALKPMEPGARKVYGEEDTI